MKKKKAGRKRQSESEDVTGKVIGEPDKEAAARFDPTVGVDSWLEYIRQLQAQGKTQEARSSLRDFRQRHPDIPVPDDLVGLK